MDGLAPVVSVNGGRVDGLDGRWLLRNNRLDGSSAGGLAHGCCEPWGVRREEKNTPCPAVVVVATMRCCCCWCYCTRLTDM